MRKYLALIVLFLVACQPSAKEHLVITEVINPSKSGGESSLSANGDELLLMSWIEQIDDSTSSLRMSKYHDGRFSESIEIAKGDNWFVNWADFPSVVPYRGNKDHLVAHWLEKSGEGTYDYDIKVSHTKDGGLVWSPSFTLHSDGIAAEHGFVSLTPSGDDKILAVWLDGRNTKENAEASTSKKHDHQGSMTLRSCTFDIDGNIYEETELDHRVCDCCQTDAIQPIGKKPLIVYRDRSDTEVRDIFIKRKASDQWLAPKPVWSEGWHVAGCPVNGPAVATSDTLVAVAWYSESNETPKVQVAFSNDHGSEFDRPIRIDNGQPIGRVDVVFENGNTVWVSWIEKTEAGAELRIAQVKQDGKITDHFVTEISPNRKSGFPILEKYRGELFLSYTDVEEYNEPKIEVKKITLRN